MINMTTEFEIGGFKKGELAVVIVGEGGGHSMIIENKIKDCKRHEGWSNNDGEEINDIVINAAIEFYEMFNRNLSLNILEIYPEVRGGIVFILEHCRVDIFGKDNATLFVDDHGCKAGYYKDNLKFYDVIEIIIDVEKEFS